MTHDTTDYEHLLDLPNIIGVEAKPDGTVVALASQKVPDHKLNPDDHVAANVGDADTDVEDMGLKHAHGFEPEVLRPDTNTPATGMKEPRDPDARRRQNASSHRDRHRPAQTGCSEMHHSGGAATAGYFPARVRDPHATVPANWSANVERGELVRLSNNHVYATENDAPFETDITQPSPLDGGGFDDTVGHMRGYVMLKDGCTVDVAARSIDDPSAESGVPHDLSASLPKSIRRDNYRALEGRDVVKSGRTTGVTHATVQHTSASIRVRYGGHLGVVTLRDQIVTSDLSDGGDSGSAVFTEDGEFIGQLFAGSSTSTIINKAANIEDEFGVELLDIHA